MIEAETGTSDARHAADARVFRWLWSRDAADEARDRGMRRLAAHLSELIVAQRWTGPAVADLPDVEFRAACRRFDVR